MMVKVAQVPIHYLGRVQELRKPDHQRDIVHPSVAQFDAVFRTTQLSTQFPVCPSFLPQR
jgi:hypothetical protein